MKPIEWTRVKNDVNGNGRVVCHFLALNTRAEIDADPWIDISTKYRIALDRARKLGGRKFHNKQFGGGIVFQAHEGELDFRIAELIGEKLEIVRECGQLTMLEFEEEDFEKATKIAFKQGCHESTAYSTTSALNGLYCVPEHRGQKEKCIIKTAELGFCVVEVCED